MLEYFMLAHGLFISNKNFTLLANMETVTEETGYFSFHSPIAILAEYFACFLEEIEY